MIAAKAVALRMLGADLTVAIIFSAHVSAGAMKK